MFYFCLFVRLFICPQNYSQELLKDFDESSWSAVGRVPRNNRLDFVGDLHHDLDPSRVTGSGSRNFF